MYGDQKSYNNNTKNNSSESNKWHNNGSSWGLVRISNVSKTYKLALTIRKKVVHLYLADAELL